MPIIRSKEMKIIHCFSCEDATKYGLEKACILGNIHKCFNLEKLQYHNVFPYIEIKKFYEILDEMMKQGILVEGIDLFQCERGKET